MGRALIQDSQVSESDEGKIEDDTIESFQDKNNLSGKRSHSLTDAHRNNYNARTSIEGYHKDVSRDSTSSDFDKEIFIKERDGQVISNNYDSEHLHGKLRGSNEKIKYLFHALAQKYRNMFLQTVADGHHGGSPVSQQRHGSAYFKNKTFMDAYLVPECTEMPDIVIDTRVFQKKDYSRQITKDVTSSLDKCGWHEPSEQENNDEASLLNEDDDTVEAELSTSDPFSEEVEDLVSESSGSYSDEISIVQTSEGSVSRNEDTEDSSTDDDCESDVNENVEDGVFIVHNDEQQIPIPVFIDVIEDDTIHDQQLAPVDNEDAFIEESSCYDETSNELSGADQPDVVSQQNRLVVPPFYPFLEAATPTDYTTKHYILTNNGYYTEMAEDALVVVNNVQIPQIPDGANPVQPRLQDGADQESHPANHLRDNSTDQTDSIEQDEDMLVSNFSLLMSLEAPQVMEKSPIHLFSASSENSQCSILGGGQEEMSDFTETGSEDDEQSDYSLSSLSDRALSVDDLSEQLDIS